MTGKKRVQTPVPLYQPPLIPLAEAVICTEPGCNARLETLIQMRQPSCVNGTGHLVSKDDYFRLYHLTPVSERIIL